MASNRVTYNVGTSNKFSGFYDENELGRYGRPRVNSVPGAPKHVSHPPVHFNPPSYQYKVPYQVNSDFSRDSPDNVKAYTEDNLYDTRARNRRPSRRYRGNPNGPRRFDRVSGTGRGRELKKQGEGGHNWGSASKESKLSTNNEVDVEDNELTKDLENLALNGTNNSEVNKGDNNNNLSKDKDNKNKNKDDKEKSPEKSNRKSDIMDFESYKLLQQSKRTNLPTFTVNDKKTVSTDTELQNHGYVRYVKESQETRLQEKVKVFNYNPTINSANLLPSHPSSFRDRDRRQKRYSGQPKKSNNPRVRVKAPDLTDLRLFPCLDMKS